MRVSMYAFLFVIIFVKVFSLERGIMARFVEDYDDEKHSLPTWIENCLGKTVEEEEDEVELHLNQLDRSGSDGSPGSIQNRLSFD